MSMQNTLPGIDGNGSSSSSGGGSLDRSELVVLAQKVFSDKTVVLPRTPMETQVILILTVTD